MPEVDAIDEIEIEKKDIREDTCKRRERVGSM